VIWRLALPFARMVVELLHGRCSEHQSMTTNIFGRIVAETLEHEAGVVLAILLKAL